MGASDQQYSALARAAEIQEGEALARRKKVEDIVLVRKQLVEEWATKLNRRRKRLEELLSVNQKEALLEGDTLRLSSIKAYERRLKRELEELQKKTAQYQADYDRAIERLKLSDQEVVEARVERKKLEQFVARRQSQEAIVSSAREEIIADELSGYRRR